MLQALRFVIQGAGAKVDLAIKKTMTTMLLGMLDHDEVWQSSVTFSLCIITDFTPLS